MNWTDIVIRIFKAVIFLVTCPVMCGATAVAFSFLMHWISGEGEILGSGDPWLMLGAMLLFPFGIIVGLVAGLVGAINMIYCGRFL